MSGNGGWDWMKWEEMFFVKSLMLDGAKKKWIKRGRGVEAGGVFQVFVCY